MTADFWFQNKDATTSMEVFPGTYMRREEDGGIETQAHIQNLVVFLGPCVWEGLMLCVLSFSVPTFVTVHLEILGFPMGGAY